MVKHVQQWTSALDNIHDWFLLLHAHTQDLFNQFNKLLLIPYIDLSGRPISACRGLFDSGSLRSGGNYLSAECEMKECFTYQYYYHFHLEVYVCNYILIYSLYVHVEVTLVDLCITLVSLKSCKLRLIFRSISHTYSF